MARALKFGQELLPTTLLYSLFSNSMKITCEKTGTFPESDVPVGVDVATPGVAVEDRVGVGVRFWAVGVGVLVTAVEVGVLVWMVEVGVCVWMVAVGVDVLRIGPEEERLIKSCGVCEPDSLAARLSCVSDKGDRPKL